MIRPLVPILLLFASPLIAQESPYVGAEACRPCHEKAFRVWSDSRHARAQTLLSAEDQRTLRCLFCHSTDAQRNLRNFRLSHVQCEACHGPGGRHVVMASEKKEPGSGKPGGLEPLAERICFRCHTEVRSPRLRPFDAESARAVIRHW